MSQIASEERTLTIGLLAGEPSGDALGAGLLKSLKQQLGARYQLNFIGVGGPQMVAEGLQELAPFESLAVNGFIDPILKLPFLLQLFRQLRDTFCSSKVDAFIGIDFNVFNFILERSLKVRGIRTAHYVSPSVYAWRRGRTKKIARCADQLFCLFPFEPPFYEGLPVTTRFVGHPMAEEISVADSGPSSQQAVRADLGIDDNEMVLALLPGSRASEIALMLEPALEAAQLLAGELAIALSSAGVSGESAASLRVVIPCINEARRDQVLAYLRSKEVLAGVKVEAHLGSARLPLIASDVALVKCGTSTLEAMLLRRPMVVYYRVGRLNYLMTKMLLRTQFFALPNILAGRMLVPELLQSAATPRAMAQQLLSQWQQSQEDADYFTPFEQLHSSLRFGEDGGGANANAASGVIELLGQERTS